MKTRWLVAIFAVGCAVLLAAFGIGWANWGGASQPRRRYSDSHGSSRRGGYTPGGHGYPEQRQGKVDYFSLSCRLDSRILGADHCQHWDNRGTFRLAPSGIIYLEVTTSSDRV